MVTYQDDEIIDQELEVSTNTTPQLPPLSPSPFPMEINILIYATNVFLDLFIINKNNLHLTHFSDHYA